VPQEVSLLVLTKTNSLFLKEWIVSFSVYACLLSSVNGDRSRPLWKFMVPIRDIEGHTFGMKSLVLTNDEIFLGLWGGFQCGQEER